MRVDIELSSIEPVDPVSLEPLPGYDPLPMGDWSEWSTAGISPNRRWLAIALGNDPNGSYEVRLVDLEGWRVVESWKPSSGGGWLQVDDGGKVYYAAGEQFSTLAPGGGLEMVELPDGFNSWQPVDVDQGHARIFGTRVAVGETSEAAILDYELATGEFRIVPLPGVRTDIIERYEIDDTTDAMVTANPVLVWDHPERALIVHADRDSITEVDLSSGEVVEHRYGPARLEPGGAPASPGASQVAWVDHRRTAALAPDGGALYIAGSDGELDVEDERWEVTTTPIGMTAVDLDTWEIVGHLDEPVSDVTISPSGDRVVASGYTDVQGPDGTYDSMSSGLVVVDTGGLEVLSRLTPENPEGIYYGPASFSPDGLAYEISWSQMATIHVIDLASGQVINTRAGEDIWMLGPIGILGGTGR